MINVIYNEEVFVDPLVTYIEWSGEMGDAFRKLELQLTNTIDGKTQAINFELGRMLQLVSNGAEIFRGLIFKSNVDHHGKMTVVAYDENIYLTKNADSKKFTGMTASAIIRQLCAEFGIPTGTIADTGYVIPKLILRDKTLFEMMVTALTETTSQSGRRFFISASGGALNLTERGEKTVDWVIENGVNLLGASYELSIEDMRNQVKVVGGDEEKNPVSVTVKDDALISRFGMMQHFEKLDSDAKLSEVTQKARQLLEQLAKVNDQATVESFGNIDVTSGKVVYVLDAMTSIVGAFYVVADKHTFSEGVHKMELTISGDDGLPSIEYEPPDPPAEKKKRKKKKELVRSYDEELAARGVGNKSV